MSGFDLTPPLEATKILLNGLRGTRVWVAPSGPNIRQGRVYLLVEIFHRLFSASQAEIGSFSLRVIDLPSAEAHPGGKLELDVIRLFGAGSKELKAIGRVQKEGVGIRLIRRQNCLESVQL